ISLARQAMMRRSSSSGAKTSQPSPASRTERQCRARQAFEKLVLPALKGKYFVSDTGRLTYPLMREMLASIRRRAKASGLADVPVVLTNHPKDLRDLPALKRFVGEV